MAIPIISLSFETISLFYVSSFIVASVASFLAIRAFTTHTIIHHKIALVTTLFFLCALNIYTGISIATLLTGVPQILSSTPSDKQILSATNPKIHIEFSAPVKFSTLRIHTYPENILTVNTDGYFQNRLSFGRSLTIMPKNSFPPDERVMIYISNIEGPLTHGFGGEKLLELASEISPVITSIQAPSLFTDVSVNQDIIFGLSKPVSNFSSWSITSVPKHEFILTANGNTLSARPASPLRQGTTYSLDIQKTPVIIEYSTGNAVEQLPSLTGKSISFTTIKPPYLKHISPVSQLVYPSEEIIFDFEQPMNPGITQEKLQLIPDVAKTIHWEQNNTRMRIAHAPFPKNSTISARLATGSQTQQGGLLESDIVYNFKTPGPVEILSHTTDPILSVVFNQPVVESSVKQKLTVSPQFAYTTTSSESAITIHPKQKLLPETTYSINFKTRIESIYGVPSEKQLTVIFTTDSVNTILPVPFYKQESAFTCNIAAAKMLLSYKHITTSEQSLITAIGPGGTRGYGNPDSGYMPDYGTYWNALSKGLNAFSPNTIIQNGTLKQILSLIESGTPVMIWGQNGWSDPHDISWTSKDGTYIRAINGMHSSVVRGFKGTADNPTDIYLNDPWRGQYSIPVSEFLRRWGYFNVALFLQ